LLQSDDAIAGTDVERNSNPANTTVETEKIALIFLIMILLFSLCKDRVGQEPCGSLPPLRTVRDSFQSHGSSIPKTALIELSDCNFSYANIARYCLEDNAGNTLLSQLFLLFQKYPAKVGL
jgi:hypothetical protein